MQHPVRLLFVNLALVALPLCAQTVVNPTTVKLDPLRVTADLWASPLESIPASVTLFNASALQAGSIRQFGDLIDEIPNLTWTGGTARPRYLQIRGVGENSQFEGETPDSAVRFLVDDFDFTGLGTIGTTLDLSQVEVLRGPQAGAFGANAAGGVVRLVTNAPTPFWTGRTEVTVGEDALRTGSFAVGGPLIAARPNELMMRVAVEQSNSDGFRDNLTLRSHTNSRDEFTGRLRLTWNPNELWHWEAAVLVADFNDGYDEFALDNNGTFTYSDQPGRDVQRSKAASLHGTFTGWDGVRFSTVSSVTRTRSIYSYDDDWTAASYMGFSDLVRSRWVFNQELRLDSEPGHSVGGINRWTLGAYFADTEEYSRYSDSGPSDVSGLKTTYLAKNAAIFGQIGHDFSPHTRLIAGLRIERFSVHGGGMLSDYDKTDGTLAAPVVVAPRFADTLFGGKLTIEHDLGEHGMVFASLTRGYKAGGINVDARIDVNTDPLTYTTEKMWNWETGLRGHWLDDRLTGEVTAFYLQRQNTQVRDSAGFGGTYRFFTGNGHDAYVTGLEAASAYAFTKAWSLRGSLALMRSELDPFVLSNGNPAGGRVLANTPRYGYTLGLHYADGPGIFGSTEIVGSAAVYDSNNEDQARVPFHIFNLNLGYAWDHWTVTFWAKNLLNENYDKLVYFFGNEDPDYVPTRYDDRADPRQVGVTAAYHF